MSGSKSVFKKIMLIMQMPKKIPDKKKGCRNRQPDKAFQKIYGNAFSVARSCAVRPLPFVTFQMMP